MTILAEEEGVVPTLTQMRLPRWVLLEIAGKIGGERANVAPHEPKQVAGYETWRWGTRYFREDQTLRELGWIACDKDQVDGIRNHDLGLKLVVCSTNGNTGDVLRSPRNLSPRGPASRRLIEQNAQQLAFEFAEEERPLDLWYFCVHASNRFISAEVSRPIAEVSGLITGFSDRIIVAKPGDIPGIRTISVTEDFAEIPKPSVTRR